MPNPTVTFTNEMSGDALTVPTATIVGGTNSTGGHLNAASYAQSASGFSGTDAGNYTFIGGYTTPTNNYVVNPLTLTGSIATGSSTYGASLAPGAVTLSTVVNGDPVPLLTC